MSTKSLKHKLIEALGDELGVFSHDEETYPCIYVGINIPNGWKPEGLQVIIHKTPELSDVEREFSSSDIDLTENYTVVMTQYDTTGHLREATKRIIKNIEGAERISHLDPIEGFFEQAKFLIPIKTTY